MTGNIGKLDFIGACAALAALGSRRVVLVRFPNLLARASRRRVNAGKVVIVDTHRSCPGVGLSLNRASCWSYRQYPTGALDLNHHFCFAPRTDRLPAGARGRFERRVWVPGT